MLVGMLLIQLFILCSIIQYVSLNLARVVNMISGLKWNLSNIIYLLCALSIITNVFYYFLLTLSLVLYQVTFTSSAPLLNYYFWRSIT